tara:strand:- start:206 stop:466 length:261 start_codon:yes stop_codon:yes gene_type:complete
MVNIGRHRDRVYFLHCIEEAQNNIELEEVGLPLTDNIVSIVAEELGQEWSVFGPHNMARERMLINLHAVADLRKLADQVEELQENT